MSVDDEIRTTADAVSEELDAEIASSDINQRWLRRAHGVVEERKPPGVDEWVLEELETLVAAHFAFPTVTGASAGQQVERVKQGQATVQYDTDVGDGPGGHASPYWADAVTFREWIADEGFFNVTRTG